MELDLEETARFYDEAAKSRAAPKESAPELQHMITRHFAVFETVVHDMPRERAFSYIEELAAFFTRGWRGEQGRVVFCTYELAKSNKCVSRFAEQRENAWGTRR